MALTLYNDTAFHEAGHGIIAYLAPETFVLEFITVNEYLSRQQDSSSLGGLKGHLVKDGETLSFQERDIMILMCLAGMAADDINHCECRLTSQLYENSIFAEKMNSKKYSGDTRLILPHLQRIVPLLKIEQRTYTKSCQKLLHELFTTDSIKTILLDLRNELANAPGKTLTGDQIATFLDNSPLKKWKSDVWPRIIESRQAAFAESKQTFWQRFISIFKS